MEKVQDKSSDFPERILFVVLRNAWKQSGSEHFRRPVGQIHLATTEENLESGNIPAHLSKGIVEE